MANPSGDPDLEYEVVGALRLKRGRGKTGYQGVYPAKSKVRPFLAHRPHAKHWQLPHCPGSSGRLHQGRDGR